MALAGGAGGTDEQGGPSPLLCFFSREGGGLFTFVVCYCCFFVTLACFVWGPRYVGYFCDGMGVCCWLDGSAISGALGGCCIRAVLYVKLPCVSTPFFFLAFCSCRSRVPITAGRAWETTD